MECLMERDKLAGLEFPEFPDGELVPSPRTRIAEVFGNKWAVWGYNDLEEIERLTRLQTLTSHQNETHLWYRALTLYYVAQLGTWDFAGTPENERNAKGIQVDLLGLGLSSAKVAIDALLAGYYSPAYATIRHMLETVLQCFYLRAFPERAYLWLTPPTEDNIKRMGAKRIRDKLLSRIGVFEDDSDRERLKVFIEEVYTNWELLSTGSHPSGSGLSQVIMLGSQKTRRLGGAYDRYMALLGFDHGLFALRELLCMFESTDRVDQEWKQRLYRWDEDVETFREAVKDDPLVVKANDDLERLRNEHKGSE